MVDLKLPFLIGKPQNRHKKQVAGLLSLVCKNFVPQRGIEQSEERPLEAALWKPKLPFRLRVCYRPSQEASQSSINCPFA